MALTTLRHLTYLDLSGNALVAGIPDGITALTNLVYLNLSRNSLTGSLPNWDVPATTR